MLVAQVVDTRVPTVHPEDDVAAAARRLVECRSGVIPVVADDEHGARLVGLLRYRDVFAALYGHGDEVHTPVAAAMTAPVTTCEATDSLGRGVRRLRRSGLDAVPVVDRDGYLVGVLSFADMVRNGVDGGGVTR